MHGESRTILPLADDFATDANDLLVASCQISREVVVMFLVIRRRHQNLDILADNLRDVISEQTLGCRIGAQYDPALADRQDRVNRAGDEGLELAVGELTEALVFLHCQNGIERVVGT